VDADECDIGQPFWKILGLSADPHLIYDVVAVIGTVDTANAGGWFTQLEYLAGD